jgi:RNA methyltransferase, rsmD family
LTLAKKRIKLYHRRKIKMRIISGTARGTKLYTLEGQTTRPTLDRVKESLFNIIQNKIQNSIFLDLFSGSGAIGLEAASRGAKKTILCDKSKEAITVIKKNIEKTHLSEKVELYNLDYELLLKTKIKEKIDIVYIDPPYDSDFVIKSLKNIIDKELVKDDSTIIIETDDEQRILDDLKEMKVEITDKRKYGRAILIFLKIRKG